ncbi:hypothetical protein CR165_19730 [Pseudoroseomonas aestuarii]|uniref:UPF0033 domain-containing protein n=2 Tax=Teichococcus aestuarii TaxID=568898 RepID=A0A2U1UZQ7_9PROT|nr:hypothetical protein CR165_19730 [Pseudoroseomonas aestuarii]
MEPSCLRHVRRQSALSAPAVHVRPVLPTFPRLAKNSCCSLDASYDLDFAEHIAAHQASATAIGVKIVIDQSSQKITVPQEELFDQSLDITTETCPMTFVRTRLALDRLPAGGILLVRLRGEEPLRNVPRTAIEQGHEVLDESAAEDGSVLLRIRKGGG